MADETATLPDEPEEMSLDEPQLQDELITVTTVLRRPVKDRFEAKCDEADRSMSAQLRRLIEQWLDEGKAA